MKQCVYENLQTLTHLLLLELGACEIPLIFLISTATILLSLFQNSSPSAPAGSTSTNASFYITVNTVNLDLFGHKWWQSIYLTLLQKLWECHCFRTPAAISAVLYWIFPWLSPLLHLTQMVTWSIGNLVSSVTNGDSIYSESCFICHKSVQDPILLLIRFIYHKWW